MEIKKEIQEIYDKDKDNDKMISITVDATDKPKSENKL